MDKVATFIRLAETIKQAIFQGDLVCGARLIESDLIAIYSISRNTLRAALQLLQEQGLVSQESHKGFKVITLTDNDIRDIYSVRRLLEISALQHGQQWVKVHLSKMLAIIEAEEKSVMNNQWKDAGTHSLRFHQEIVRLHNSARLNKMFAVITAQLRLLFSNGINEKAFQQPWVAKDIELYQLIKQNKFDEAENYLRDYLKQSETILLTN